MNITVSFNNFATGEISPLLAARQDTAAYNLGARRMENFLPMETGGIRKRPGSWHDGYTLGRTKARLVDFHVSSGQTIIVEFTNDNARFWLNDYTLLRDGNDTVVQITTQYTQAALEGLKFAASKDVLWIVHPLYRPKRILWNDGAPAINAPDFSGQDFTADPDNYPAAVAFNSGRLWFAATTAHPNRIWSSRSPDAISGQDRYLDFTPATQGVPMDGDGIVLEENDMHGSKLLWLAPHHLLIAATDKTTWSDNGEIPTPSGFDMNIVEYAGALAIQGKGSREALVYAGADGKSLRALVYTSGEYKGFMDMKLSDVAEHLLLQGIRDLTVTEFPSPVVWIAMSDGTLVSCALNLRGGIAAFARHSVGGFVESIAPGRNVEKQEDCLWMSVERNSERRIEHIALGNVTGAQWDESHYVDAGIRIELSEPSQTVSGLTHLLGREVTAFADGAITERHVVNDEGTVTFNFPVKKLHIGLPYESIIEAVSPEIPANGSSIGKKRRIEKATLRLYKSLGGVIGTTEEKLVPLLYSRYGAYTMGSAPESFTGDIDISVQGRIDPSGRLMLRHGEPCPFTLLALAERIAIMEA
jgi:hypothetical protein